ncbi:UbiA family prenyltransferase, partial [Klebsiella pneumoniae]|nr:UbiA family prenyltransferase [Klebsiella pneumoniae]
LLAFFTFGLCVSSVYLLNDHLDLEDDRHHPVNRKRPPGSGALPLTWGIGLFPVLLIGSFALAWMFLPWRFCAVLLGYYVLTLANSMFLKRQVHRLGTRGLYRHHPPDQARHSRTVRNRTNSV